ncbi:MAG: hypothetical protein RIQ47_1108 [Bacteroidota bacterium]|jgi:hypothetical protein
MRNYPLVAFEKLATAIREKDEDALQWLRDNGFPELAHFWDAVEGMEMSFRWLLDNEFRHLAALVDGLAGKDTAKAWLLQSGYATLAAFIEASEGSPKAVAFLIKSGEKGWIHVAKSMMEREKKKNKSLLWSFLNFGNPFR